MKKTVIAGPFGGEIGSLWDHEGNLWDHGAHTSVRQMVIRSRTFVDSIAVEYDENGCSMWFKASGSSDGEEHQIKLDYPDEYLTSISGYYNEYPVGTFISSMKVKSNKRTFGPFGTKIGNYFLVPSTAGKIVGFFGSYGSSLTSIGAYVEPIYPFKFIGPFGGNTGTSWDDGVYNTIRRITVVSESVINSILIEYDKDGILVSSSRHGGNNGGNTNVVELDYPEEYVTSISGYHGANSFPILVQSLKVHTNRQVYGPFGLEKGKYFSFPPIEGKIIGFHGNCGAHLYSIGGHCEHTSNSYMVKTVGPFGKGNAYSWDDEIHSAINQIRIVHGDFVNSISTKYYDDDGLVVWSNVHGGDKGPNIDTIKLDFPYEFLTSVDGYYDGEMNDYVFTSLTFQSNRRTYGPFGRQFGTYFCFPSFDGKILGFHGRSSSDSLYALGAHVEPISYPKPSEFIGPFGGQGGELWDDGIHTTIRQLVISCGSMVNSISIEYDKNGHSIWSSKHGHSIGDKTYAIKLDYPDEFLISLSGSYSPNASSTKIQSLKLQSNKKTYGPFGRESGKYEFSLSSIAYGKIIGFHGRCGDYLHSIGVYLKPIPMSYQYQTCEQYGGQKGVQWDDGIHTTIRQLIVGAGIVVDSLHVEYDKHGRSLWSQKRGSSNGGKKYMVKLDYPVEYLVSISGYSGLFNSSTCICSLTIESNRRTYGPFGTKRGDSFSTPPSRSKIIGFHGSECGYLTSIGVHANPFSLGPFGGQGGDPWDDRIYSTLRQIQLTVWVYGIESVRFEYDKNGHSVWSPKHGSEADGKLEKVILDYPGEFLLSVSGTYGNTYDFDIVLSLTFQSNRKTYGPFGLDQWGNHWVNHFSLALPGHKINGFHGRCGCYINAIGAYVEPI